MTLDQLKILVAIADRGSVLGAARSLHRTQPTLSVLLQKLEEELGVQLLDRSSYRAMLTPAGWQLYKKAKGVLAQVDDLANLAHYLAVGNEPSLALAVEASCPMPLVLEILQSSDKKYPQTEFNLQVENIWGAIEKLREGEVDLAVSPWFLELEEFDSIPLTRTRLLAVAVPGFLANREDLDTEVMKGYVQIVVRDSSNNPDNRSYGVLEGGRHWVVGDHMTKKQLILAGLGWGKLQESLIEEELKRGELVLLAIDRYPCSVDIEIRAMRRQGQLVGPVAASLWDDFSELGRRQAWSKEPTV